MVHDLREPVKALESTVKDQENRILGDIDALLDIRSLGRALTHRSTAWY